MSLGYGNFSTVIQYDIYAMASKFVGEFPSFDESGFADSEFCLDFTSLNLPQFLTVLIFRFCLCWLTIRFVTTITETKSGSLSNLGHAILIICSLLIT